MPDPVVPDAAVKDAHRSLKADRSLTDRASVQRALEAAAPKLYAHWAEQLVARIRDEGRSDGTALRELVVDQMPPWAGLEDAADSEMADGVANWIASLLGLGDRSS